MTETHTENRECRIQLKQIAANAEITGAGRMSRSGRKHGSIEFECLQLDFNLGGPSGFAGKGFSVVPDYLPNERSLLGR